jgi:hypothetical protein
MAFGAGGLSACSFARKTARAVDDKKEDLPCVFGFAPFGEIKSESWT